MKPAIVILTGAGISAESGLKTFRDSDGLWKGNHVEDLATKEAFGRNAHTVHQFYNERRRQLHTVKPNAAHRALAHLQNHYEGEITIITQNVDNLHEEAGSTGVLHVHGRILRKKCTWCEFESDCFDDLDASQPCQSCSRTGGLRPDIVWFGETPYHLPEIETALASTKIFIAIGTSGHVHPVAGFVEYALTVGAKAIEVNKTATQISEQFHETRLGNATKTVPMLCAELLTTT